MVSLFFLLLPPLGNPSEHTIPERGLIVADITSETFSVYPNPTKDVLYIAAKSEINVEKIEVYSITGKLLLEKDNIKVIDLKYFPKGMYFLNIVADSGSFTKKVIKK